MKPTTAALAAATLALAACSDIVTKGDPASPYMFRGRCATSDWYQVGYYNGYEGQPRERFALYSKNCSQLGAAPDRDRFFEGYEDGRRDAGISE